MYQNARTRPIVFSLARWRRGTHSTPFRKFGIEEKAGLASPEAWLSDLFGVSSASSGVSVKRGKHYLCDLQPMYAPDVWAAYCLRNQAKVRRLIVGKAVTITTALRQRGKALCRA